VGHPVGVDAQAFEELGGLGGGDDRTPGEGRERRPLALPAAVRALVDGLRGRDVQLGGESGRGEGGPAYREKQTYASGSQFSGPLLRVARCGDLATACSTCFASPSTSAT